MMETLPEGTSIGWMQAPPSWIFSHTIRFVGVARIVIQDGEGYILINKGNPLAYYFRHGTRELRGHAALDYFNSHPIIEFNLCKYTPEEFALAQKYCAVETEIETPADDFPTIIPKPERETNVSQKRRLVIKPDSSSPIVPSTQPAPEPVAEPKVPQKRHRSIESVIADLWEEEPDPEQPIVQSPVDMDEHELDFLRQVKELNGIVAVSVFSQEKNIHFAGDADEEYLLGVARRMLTTAKTITPLLDWGAFVHMTIQVPDGNVIIAPYHQNFLCLFTTHTINIGHIRRILVGIQENENSPAPE